MSKIEDNLLMLPNQYEVKINFPEIYQTPEWLALDKIDRAQLLLIIEGAKNGTFIEGDYTNFQKIIKETNLAIVPTTFEHQRGLLYPAYAVAYPDKISAYLREWLTLPEDSDPWIVHKIDGKFLGYPQCCIEEYIEAGKKELRLKKEVIPKFESEMKEIFKQNDSYPKELEYCPPSFTPCGIHCKNALEMLSRFKKILEKADPEAAQALRRINRLSFAIMRQEVQKDHIADKEKIDFLKKTVSGSTQKEKEAKDYIQSAAHIIAAKTGEDYKTTEKNIRKMIANRQSLTEIRELMLNRISDKKTR